ncbi:dihydroneopterin aldolase [Streptosporangium becharense]|uniref:7,8-dihydroneopterin aldolase n=1 Tax=Streptosporangium becharense TaxID=1816182 RepID=A0A7W9IH48_9ACTN|nr:dihydroneopterin aldolase [Streptosporangium becharense]MBB5820608.1 dihydroneopterin aldolase [Streptosporangium becharense]
MHDPLRQPPGDPVIGREEDPFGDRERSLLPGPSERGQRGAGPWRVPDRISLKGLRVRGRHGVLPAERELGQEFVVDVVLFLDTAPAAAGDDLTLTVHYGELAEDLARVVAGEPVDLIETLAQRLADVCLAREQVWSVEVSVHKPAAPIPLPFDDVVVTITRSRS